MRPDHVAPTRFSDRAEAGEYLAAELEHHAADENVVVLGLLSGGVPVAAAIAKQLGVEVDALAVSGLVLPERSTVAYAALAAYGDDVSLKYVARVWGPAQQRFTTAVLAEVEAAARTELKDLQQRLVGEVVLPVKDRTVILCDDGMATGATMLAAVEVMRHAGAARIVVAVPVATLAARQELEAEADEFLCAITPKVFNTVSAFYSRFDAVSDDEVVALIPHL
ncbi:phosphoribosyltransferase [Paeniglutamicibacter kerguelensis]|uniref:Phosphoribosyltransferase n=1 Tax=Paeniglutamicibacter kerguelensis TaxID=254788 RepID=A0ABS4XAJ4_9MICC|nr:phosphoribosyltransferase family protein [Paeniglutamicibacter kerguelensis]MBP2385485.1 putative phosphoribosyltransferase [Paeniglutamicibacter kerguelensis]